MDRYTFADNEEHIQRIVPHQLWIRKNSPSETLVILNYMGDKTYECLSISSAIIGIPLTMSSSQISSNYNFSHTVDNQ